MQIVQGIVTAGVAIFVALIGYFQWRTAQEKAVLDLFERRHAIYETVRNAVGTMAGNSKAFDQSREAEFIRVMERAYFFFGDDVDSYIRLLWSDINEVRTADTELQGPTDDETRRVLLERRRALLTRIGQFHSDGMPLFAGYMRFSQTMPTSMLLRSRKALMRICELLGASR
jgi:hypothetical protein